MQSAQFRFKDKFETEFDNSDAIAVVQVTQETDYIFTVSAWIEFDNGSSDALYTFLEGYVLQSHGGQICFDCMADAIRFVRDAMSELGFVIKALN